MKFNKKVFTKWVSIGWWVSFGFFMIEGLVIDYLSLVATPWLGLSLFVLCTLLTLVKGYDKSYRYSPYSALLRMLKKEKK